MRNRPKVETASTLVLPCRSPKWPHQPVVSADSNPMVVVIMVCKRAAPAWTAGSEKHRVEGMRRGSSVPSESESSPVVANWLLEKVTSGLEKRVYGWKFDCRGSIAG